MNPEKNLNDNKIEFIIRTAQKRFGLYGIEKTTMREVAADLGISKGLLYYYFPDKESLYKAVIEKEQAEFIRKLEAEVPDFSDPAESLRKYVSIRLTYFKSLMNIGRLRVKAYSELKPLIAESMKKFREKESKIVIEILEEGNKKKIFHTENIPETVSLFLDLLRGLRIAVFRDKEILVIDDSEYNELSAKALAFTEMFIKSLMCK